MGTCCTKSSATGPVEEGVPPFEIVAVNPMVKVAEVDSDSSDSSDSSVSSVSSVSASSSSDADTPRPEVVKPGVSPVISSSEDDPWTAV